MGIDNARDICHNWIIMAERTALAYPEDDEPRKNSGEDWTMLSKNPSSKSKELDSYDLPGSNKIGLPHAEELDDIDRGTISEFGEMVEQLKQLAIAHPDGVRKKLEDPELLTVVEKTLPYSENPFVKGNIAELEKIIKKHDPFDN